METALERAGMSGPTTPSGRHENAATLPPARLRAEPGSARCGYVLKRALDLTGATVGLVLAAPLGCLIGAAIRLESGGAILYRQVRVGKDRRPFTMYKFRSMVEDAERETGAVWSTRGDPRVTRVGAVLRRTHLDELPQLVNVLRGEMSLVGPRPERPEFVRHLSQAIPGYEQRFAVPPGITGLAQVRSGYDQTLRTVYRKLRYDRYYIRRASFGLDLRLLLGTLVHVAGAVIPAPRRRLGSRSAGGAS